ncbi:BZ3500_MvSof-1268-A1-R1_Chr4-3g07287 [Microbotryum saponariae]|uniref:BZ3500_MvSof-1268-A1-R1_Chr4-3g07287 protein n=1 Tax=Microbotryum saponariae TaxID=289078 RepID=A0A2X0KUI3_9BASI|nr:BZ3500_MvSof-1268-A1-R1_Chr4-3g07287 [Microbotryum saponariae]SDA06950.1 BZ3501_MvSof-1269-A2-R1_Chr4-2g06996 [Microbotryum saponariae]
MSRTGGASSLGSSPPTPHTRLSSSQARPLQPDITPQTVHQDTDQDPHLEMSLLHALIARDTVVLVEHDHAPHTPNNYAQGKSHQMQATLLDR